MADQNFRVKRGLEVGIGGTIITAESSGNIGINSAEPTAKLDINGTVKVGSAISFYADTGYVYATEYFGGGGNLGDIIKEKIEGITVRDSDNVIVGSALSFSTIRFTNDFVTPTVGSGVSTVDIGIGTVASATTATNISAGSTGDIPYQSATGLTTFLQASTAENGEVILWSDTLNAPYWGPLTDSDSALGITVKDEGVTQIGNGSINTINFTGDTISVTNDGVGVATVTVTQANPSITDETSSSSTHYIHFGDLTAGEDNINVSSTDLVFIPSTGNLGIGSTQPSSKLDVNGLTQLDDINVSGAATIFNLTVNGTTNFIQSTVSSSSSITNLDVTGIATVATLDVTGLTTTGQLYVSGLSTFTGSADFNGSIDVDGLTELDDVNVSGASTFTGAADFNGSIDVDGLTELDDVNVSGASTFTGSADFNSSIDVTGLTTTGQLYVSGVSTFTGDADFNGSIDVDGLSELDDVNVSGASTFTGAADFNGSIDVDGLAELDDVNVSGASTFTGAVDFNGSIDVDGLAELDDVNVSGASTFTGAVDFNGSIDVDGLTELDDVNVSGVSTFTGTASASNPSFIVDGPLQHKTASDKRARFGSTWNTPIFEVSSDNNINIFNSGTNKFRVFERESTNTPEDGQFVEIDHGKIRYYSETSSDIFNIESEQTIEINWHNSGGSDKTYAKFNPEESVELYYNNEKKFETNSSGIGLTNGSSDTVTISGPDNIIIDPSPVGVGTTSGVVRIKGDLYVDGTNFIVDSETITLADHVVGIASTATTDILTDGAGIGIGSDKFFTFDNTNTAFKSTENLNLESGHTYKIDGTDVLSSSTLGSNVTNSSLTNLGTLTGLNVNGHSELDNVNISGVATIGTSVEISSDGINAGASGIVTSQTFESTATTGTAPFTVASTTKVVNLNVDQLDGIVSGSFLRSDEEDTKSSGSLIFSDSINLEFGSDSDFEIDYVDSTKDLRVTYATDNAEKISIIDQNGDTIVGISSTGFVGIKSAIPGYELDINGDINFSGNLYQGGTLFDLTTELSEDDTPALGGELDLNSNNITGTGNIDITGTLDVSGISTFGNELHVGYQKEIYFANNSVYNAFQISQNGTTQSLIKNNVAGGSIIIATGVGGGGYLQITNISGSETAAKFTPGGAAELYHDGNPVLETIGTGVTVTGTGDLYATTLYGDGSNLTNILPPQINISATTSTANAIYPVFVANNSTGGQSPFIDNQIYYDASGTDEKLVVNKLSVTSALYLGDSDKLLLGNSEDLQIYHSGSNYIDSQIGASGLQIRATLGNIEFKLKGRAENALKLIEDGAVELYYDNDKKLETTNDGVVVTGILTATSFDGDGSKLTNLPPSPSDGTGINIGLTTTVYASASNDIDGYTGIGISFPSTSGKKYLVTSIHVTNVVNADMYLTSRIDYEGGENVPLTNRTLIPYQGAVEILEDSIITNPSDKIRFASFTGIGTTAGAVANALDCWITYEEHSDTNYIGVGSTGINTGITTVFTSSGNPSIINTINLTNYNDSVDVDTNVSIYRNGTVRQGYLVKNLTIPQNSSVQILPRAKRLNASDTIVVTSGISSSISVNITGKYLT